MFHVELRQFPHNFCRFNLSEQELRAAVLDAWARREWIEFGERRWDPHQANLTVLEGPRLSMQELSMGRGWRNAQRRGSDVTERMLEAVRSEQPAGVLVDEGGQAPTQAVATPSVVARAPERTDSDPAASPAEELVALLGEDPLPLMRAWQLALERHPDRTPSECLALAEDLVRR